MFKKRNTDKKAVDIGQDIETIQIDPEHHETLHLPKSVHSKKINKFSNKASKQQSPDAGNSKEAPVRYGLINKEEVNSKYHANQDAEEEKPKESNSLVNLYVKKKMEELANQTRERTEREQEMKNTAAEIMEMQKKYLETSTSKLAEYSIEEIQRKLEKMAAASIKSELQNRTSYLKNLLENEFEKMQYASKKELKSLKQSKERLEQQFQSKYKESGRRSYVDKMKFNSMMGR